jgi:hypothetical protein
MQLDVQNSAHQAGGAIQLDGTGGEPLDVGRSEPAASAGLDLQQATDQLIRELG